MLQVLKFIDVNRPHTHTLSGGVRTVEEAAACGSDCDNIAGKSFATSSLCLSSVDIVYTWVNGSDPRLIRGISSTVSVPDAHTCACSSIFPIVDLRKYTGVAESPGMHRSIACVITFACDVDRNVTADKKAISESGSDRFRGGTHRRLHP